MYLSIVVPAYNEESVIGEHLDAILAYCDAQPWDFEVLVVDDGSVDRTAPRVDEKARQDPRIRLLRLEENRGKGFAVRKGLLEATGDIRGFTDADGATDISELDRVLRALESGAQVAIGSRAKRDAEVVREARFHRVFMGRVFNGLLRILVGLKDRNGDPIADSQCGFKWFSAEAAEAILSRASEDGFAFDVELLHLANRLDLGIEEVPIHWADRGQSTVNLWLDPLRMLFRSALIPMHHRGIPRVGSTRR